MAGRLVKCKECNLKDSSKENMIGVTGGYVHPACHNLYIADKKGRTIKCKECGISDTPKSEMVEFKKGQYCHEKCHEKLKEKQAFIDAELKELDSLYEIIKGIHQMPSLPSGFVVMLQDLRNGTIKLSGRKLTKKKQGVKYSIMEKAYLLCKEDIQKAKRTVPFKSSMGYLVYGFKVVQGKLNEAYAQKQKEKIAKQQNEASKLVLETVEKERTVVRRPNKKDENDISEFLD